MEIKHSDTQAVEHSIKEILRHIGEVPERPGLVGTPDRMVRMFKEIFRGYNPEEAPKITTFRNGEDGVTYNGMVSDTGSFYSMCEHHCMPFFGSYWFAYIPHPNGKVIGLSKIARIVDYHSARLQVQERLVTDIIKAVEDALQDDYPPQGIALIMEGEHLCKTMRGVKKPGKMAACIFTGAFENAATRAEFMQFVQINKK
ncbi:MAG: GTP cyclohydrolase I [Tannerellaceae bacterium]|nr:GTP cyclohydrolase I [Tannerellaceae bacterium]